MHALVPQTFPTPPLVAMSAWRRLGLIALATDLTSERDFIRLLPMDQAGLYTTRVAFDNPTTPENLQQMAPRLTAATRLILPDEPLDAICYSCTAASVIIGDDIVRQAIQQARPGVPVVTPAAAARAALSALGVRRIAILAPYLVQTCEPMAAYFTQHGFDIVAVNCFGMEDDREMARVSRDSIVAAAVELDTDEAEALFISCTALPSVAAIAEIESRIGKPVVTSNQASAWALLQHTALSHRPAGYGRLFSDDVSMSHRFENSRAATGFAAESTSIERAARRLVGKVLRTPLVASPTLTGQLGVPVHLKLENLQITGSFKVRGATHAVLCLDDAARSRGVVGVSTGNHGRGLAHAARLAGVRCIVCMSSLVPQNKIDGIKALGAEVRIVGISQDEAQLEVDRLVNEEGMTLLPPFDHADIIAGQGTLGLELLKQLPELSTLLIPVSGGGLFAGVATAVKMQRADVRLIGVSMRRGAAMHASLQAGKPVAVAELSTLADSLGGGIGLHNRYTFEAVRTLIDEFVRVDEADIAAAIRHGYWCERQILEGSGAVCIAALLSGQIQSEGPVLALCSGGNIDMALHHRIITGENVDVTEGS